MTPPYTKKMPSGTGLPLEAREGRERGGQQMPAIHSGKAQQHEREAGHEQRRRNLAGKHHVDGAAVIVAHDERADTKVDIATNDEHADPDGKLTQPRDLKRL